MKLYLLQLALLQPLGIPVPGYLIQTGDGNNVLIDSGYPHISDLTNAIGIAPPSLYAAFGSKEALYRETLDRYAGLPGALSNLSAAKSLKGMVKRLLRSAVNAVTDPSGEGGCMISNGIIQCASEHADLAADLAESEAQDARQDCRRAHALARRKRGQFARALSNDRHARSSDPSARSCHAVGSRASS